MWWLIPGIASLLAFAYLLTLVEITAAGRAYAAYGGVYIGVSLVWLHLVEGVRQDSLAEPRLEPEIALVLAKAPRADMDLAELADCVGWVAPAFEIVQSIYPGWQFDITDCIVAGALHGRLLLGPRVSAQLLDLEQLPEITVTLCINGETVEEGIGANALDGPIHALAHLVALLEADPQNPPLAAGEIVSTGTLTDAWPIAPDETWSARYRGAFELEISIRIN